MKKRQLKEHVVDIIIAVLFSFVTLLGINAEIGESLFVYFKDVSTLILSFIILIFLIPIHYIFILFVKYIVDKLCKRNIKWIEFSSKFAFFKVWIFIFVAWLPIAIFRYPAGVEWDAYHQIDAFINGTISNQYWPYASSVFMGSVVSIGKIITGSYNIGLFMLVIVQMAFMAYVFTYSVKLMIRLSGPRYYVALAVVFYVLCPVISITCTSVVKDIMFSGFVLLFSMHLCEVIIFNDNIKKILFSALFMVLFRTYGILILLFIIIIAFVKKIIYKDDKYSKIGITFLGITILYSIYSSVLLPSFGVAKMESSGFYFLPMMQTARYVKYYPNDVTDKEKELISAAFDYDKLAENYDPLVADPIWNLHCANSGKDYIKYLFGAWLPEFFRHPSVYFSATFINLHGFIYPFSTLESYNGLPSYDIVLYFNIGDPWNHLPEYYSIPESIMPARQYLLNILVQITGNPLYRLFNSVAVHVWILLYIVLKNIVNKNEKILVIGLPSFVNFLVCWVSTTYYHNGARYALPIIFCSAFIVFVSKSQTSIDDSNGSKIEEVEK